jgi:hypothetical protein
MALGHTFYHKTIRKMVVLFGSLFNDINVRRFDANGDEIKRFKVPVSYAPKEKTLARVESGGIRGRQTAIPLPVMSFEMTGLNFDPERKVSNASKIVAPSSSTSKRNFYSPTPYLFDFSLYVYANNQEDATQILEQILPYFRPHFTVSIQELEDVPELKRDIPIRLDSISSEDSYDGDFESRRAIVYTLNFTLEGNIYGQVSDTGIITKAFVDIWNTPDFAEDTELAYVDAEVTPSGAQPSDSNYEEEVTISEAPFDGTERT